MRSGQGRMRVIIEGVKPEVDCGRYPIKRTVGETVVVEADAFTDGHDLIRCVLRYRREETAEWTEVDMTPLVNDRWRGEFPVIELGRYLYSIVGWVDHFQTWTRDLRKKSEAGQDVSVDLLTGVGLIDEAIPRASGADVERLRNWANSLRADGEQEPRVRLALDGELGFLMARHPDRSFATVYDKNLIAVVDRVRARYGTWYEVFPRSCSPEPGKHGTLKDCEARLPYVASMGFDVLYLPPVHPIGTTFRKGRNNSTEAGPSDPGSPWGIGSAQGGHKYIHPDLGTIEDFHNLLARAVEHGIEIAMDVAFQCSPDHPYVKQHPDWFRHRPDGTIQYAENPPKKYQDIYPLDFETEHWRELWEELKSVIVYWIEQGVRIFRVDNPHTKPFRFWEWLINDIKKEYPDVIFLAEAFTRPKVMYSLAKLGFTQSYSYFAWRNGSWEIAQYFTELTQTDVKEYFRPNLWPNTPDILTEYLQTGGRPAFMARIVLAATLGASYGIYGPAFESMENRAVAPGKEEYFDSEKYEIKNWELNRPDSLRDFITRLNRIRRENPALHSDASLRFHSVDNPALVCYSKQTVDVSNVIVTIVNVDAHRTHSGWVTLPLESLGIDPSQPYQVHDLLGDAYYQWNGPRNYVELNPSVVPAHVLRIRHRVRTERDFEYYL